MSDRESSAVGFRLRGMAPPDLSTYPDKIKLMFWQFVTDAALAAKDKELAKGWDKDGNVHPLKPATIKHRKSEVGPVTKTAPRLEPALKRSRVRSLLRGRAHLQSAELFWDFDAVTGDSFAVILHHAAEAGHDVFGLSDRGTSWVRSEAMKKWQAWKAEAGPIGPTVKVPGAQAIPKREVKRPIEKREVKGRLDIENFTLSSTGEKLREAIEAGEFTGFRRLNARGEQWRPGTGIPPAPGGPGPGAILLPRKPAPKPKPVRKPAAKPQTFEDEVNAMLAKRQLGQSGLAAIKDIIAKHAIDIGEHQVHGMSYPEKFRAIDYAGIKWHIAEYGFADEQAAKAIKEFHGRFDQIPERLRKATSDIWFANQKNKDDAFWREQYKNGVFGASAATGGDGRIVVYEFATLPVRRFAHESGHNLAAKIYGDPNPRGNYLDLVLRRTEPPVSKYAMNSPAEDFAEACRLYVEDIDELRTKFPERYSIIHKLMMDPSYGG
jgi:hypothetical protein